MHDRGGLKLGEGGEEILGLEGASRIGPADSGWQKSRLDVGEGEARGAIARPGGGDEII
jgi:hypothetical protein